MGDWLFEHPILCLLVIVLIVGGGFGYLASKDFERKERLMQECMADGNKEYICEGLLKGRGPKIVPQPIFIR